MKKIPAKYYDILFPFAMVITMLLFMSTINAIRAVGFSADFWRTFGKLYASNLVVVLPVVYVVIPLVKILLNRIIENAKTE